MLMQSPYRPSSNGARPRARANYFIKMDSIFYVAISLSLLLLLVWKLLLVSTNKNKNKKKYPPSPPSLPIIGHLHLFKTPLHQTLARISALHGPILLLRFGSRPILVVSSLPLAEECLTTNDITFANRVRFPSDKLRSYNYSTIGTTNYGPHWRNMRRLATVEVLSSHRLSSFITVRSVEVRAMVGRLFSESKPLGFGKVDLKSRLFEFALNNVTSMIAGKSYSGDRAALKRYQEVVEAQLAMTGPSYIGDYLPLVRWMDFRAKKKHRTFAEFNDVFLKGLINEVKGEGKEGEKRSMIGVLLSLQKMNPEYYTDHNIKAIVSSMLQAGTDTTSDTIEWLMALLLNNPDKLRRLQAEIDELVIGDNKQQRLLQESDVANLPYLSSVVTEGLRLYPEVPLLVPHESSVECEVGGYTVPRGTMLLVNIYAIHRGPDYGWDDPEKFKPERFETINENDDKLMPFGMGRRRCPAEGLARRVLGLVLGTLIQCFDWERMSEELVDMTEGSGLTMPKAVPLEAIYRPREKMESILSAL